MGLFDADLTDAPFESEGIPPWTLGLSDDGETLPSRVASLLETPIPLSPPGVAWHPALVDFYAALGQSGSDPASGQYAPRYDAMVSPDLEKNPPRGDVGTTSTQIADAGLPDRLHRLLEGVPPDISNVQGPPAPVVLGDGRIVLDSFTHNIPRPPNADPLKPAIVDPLLQPPGADLARNAAIGAELRKLPFADRMLSMVDLFSPGRRMDYQQTAGSWDYADFGNFNYGVVAAAAGIPRQLALIAAGGVNFLHSGGPKYGQYFNDPRNTVFINKGYDAFERGAIPPLDE